MNTAFYSNKDLIKDIWKFIQPYKYKFYVGTIIRITSDLVWLFPIWALAEIITEVSHYSQGNDTLYIWQLMGCIAVAGLYHFIAHDICKYYLYQVAEYINIDAQKKTIQHMYSLDMQWHEKENTGNKMQKILKGGDSLNKIVRAYVDMMIESTINLIAVVIILSTLNIYFAFILIFFFITFYMLSLYMVRKAVLASHNVNVEFENYSGVAFESINNIGIIKSLGAGNKIFPFILHITKRLTKKLKVRIYRYRIRAITLHLYQEFFRQLMIVFTLFQIFNGNLEIGVLAMVLLYFGKIKESASEFASTYNQFINAKIAIERMNSILNTPAKIEKSGMKNFPKNWKTLSLQNLSFSYHGNTVLNNFSIDIKRGEKIGIVGVSGTGKSTLFKLLLKLHDGYKGNILFDTTSLSEIKRESYIKNVAIVPQETELFNMSLEENITMSQHTEDKNLLDISLEIAHVKDFIHKLRNGVSSLVGEKGVKLSGGEKQRVGIARAIYKKPEILFLDEATSHLDIQSEQKIQEALHVFLKDITAIVIAHRLSTIKEMDRIIVMDNGRVSELGSFDELIQKKGIFYTLWKSQQL